MKAQRARNEFSEAARQPNNGCLKIGSWCFFIVYFWILWWVTGRSPPRIPQLIN